MLDQRACLARSRDSRCLRTPACSHLGLKSHLCLGPVLCHKPAGGLQFSCGRLNPPPSRRLRPGAGSPMSYQAPDEACARRREALEAASAGLLARLCGPGDFLPASRRTAVVREALATAGCATCRALHGANKAEAGPEALRQIETDHSFAEPLCRGDLGSLVHELANHQRRLDETWHAAAAERLWDVLTSVGEALTDN